MLHISGLSLWYTKDEKILHDVVFTLPPHTVIGLLGVNGAGKTTLINFLSGVHRGGSSDTVTYNKRPVSVKDAAFKSERYTVFTEEQAFSYWSFEDYIRFTHKVYGKPLNQSFIDTLVEGFGFSEYRKYKIKDLSTGNRKKVFLITGFSLCLPLLVLDEPLDGLDFASSEFLYKAINEYKAYGSVLMSSHIAESFEKTCDHILLLSKGRITEKDFASGMDIRAELAGWLHEHD